MAAVPAYEKKGLSSATCKLCDQHLNLGLFALRAGALAHTPLPPKVAHRPPGSSDQAFASFHLTSCKARVVSSVTRRKQEKNRGNQGLTAPEKQGLQRQRERRHGGAC